jgi:hypothetical protein
MSSQMSPRKENVVMKWTCERCGENMVDEDFDEKTSFGLCLGCERETFNSDSIIKRRQAHDLKVLALVALHE